jgi:diacylglycerol O-acyltransferase 1
MLSVFVFSAIFHEYFVAGIFGKITMTGFNGMMVQLPVIMIQEKYKKLITPEVGNAFFWVFFCMIGQPVGLVMLYMTY